MKFLKNLSKRERTWVALAAAVILIAGIDRLVLTPVRKNIENMQQQIDIKRGELATYQRSAAARDKVDREYARYRKYLRAVGTDEKETSRILGTIEGVARVTKVNLLDTKPRESRDEGWYKQFNVEIEMESTMADLTRFLYRLNQTPEALRVEKIQISARGKDSPYVRTSALVSRIAGTVGAE
jgi:type II secretory pathway component PulM